MAKYSNISATFWTDGKVDDNFTPEDKYFYLYTLTNPHTSLAGCYEISLKQMERETGYNSDTVKRLIQRLDETHGVIRYSYETKEMLVLNWWKYNWSTSDKVRSAIVSIAPYIKSEKFRRYVMDRVSIRYGYPMHTTDTETVSVTEPETEPETETENRKQKQYYNSCTGESRTTAQQSVKEVLKTLGYKWSAKEIQSFIAYNTEHGWKMEIEEAVKAWEKNRHKPKRKQSRQMTQQEIDEMNDYLSVANRFREDEKGGTDDG